MNSNNKKRYKITSKFRFTLFLLILILSIFTAFTSIVGFNTVTSASLDQYNQVKIESGDTIWNIAKAYAPNDKDVREVVYEICQLNDMKADQLKEGQKIIIPVYS